MAFGFLQSTAGGATPDPTNLNYLSALTSGSLLIAAITWNDARTITSVSDVSNGNWTAIGSPTNGAGTRASQIRQMFYVASNVATSAVAVTIDWSAGPSQASWAIHEYSRSGITPVIDGTPLYDNATGTTPTTGTITTTVDADLLFAMLITGTVSAAGSGYVLRESTGFSDNGTEDDVDGGTAGGKTASFTTTTGDQMLGFVAFRDADPAPPPDVRVAWLTA